MKKIIAIALTVFMMMSLSVYAADSVTVTESNKTETTYYATKTFWDVDFDSTYTINQAGGAVKKDGADLNIPEELNEFDNESSNMKGETVTTNVGNAVNKSTLSTDEAVADADHEYFLKLETTADGKDYEVQMNQMPIIAKGGIVVVQNDFAIGTLPTENNYIRVQHVQLNAGDTASYNTAPFSSVVKVTADGVIWVHNTKTKLQINANEWHTATQVINMDAGRIDFYIDGNYAGFSVHDNIKLIWKMCFYHPKGGNDELVSYYDNIKVFKASTNMVAITADEPAATVAEGSPVALKTFNFNEDIVKEVKIYFSTDNINYTEYSDEAEPYAYYEAITTYYKAVAFDADGNKVSESDPVKLATGNVKENGAEYWDVDFEEGYTLKSGVLTYDDVTVLSPLEQKFSTNAGAAGSVIKIDTVEGISGNESDRVLILDNTGATEPNVADTPITAQINALNLGTTDNILVCEYSFACNELPAVTNNVVGRIEGTYVDTDTGRTFDNSTIINLDIAGNLYIPAIGTKNAIKATPNTWYNVRQIINLEAQKTDTYINDKYMGTVGFNADKNWTKIRRFSASTGVAKKNIDDVSMYVANNNILYYDNIKFYSVAETEAPVLGIADITYFIDGDETTQISEGNLTANVVVTNNAQDNTNATCFAAVYSAAGKLESVSIIPVAFEADDFVKLMYLDFGTVSATDTVKIFFWNIDNNTMVPNGANNILGE